MTTAASTSAPDRRLAEDFDAATREAWLALVDKAIKGADFEKRLVGKTADGLRIEPLYRRQDARDAPAPGVAPFTRGTRASVRGLGWEVHQAVSTTDPAAANRELLEELEAGANGIVLAVEAPGQAGVRLRTAADVRTALAGMDLELAPLQIAAGLDAVRAARHVLAALPDLAPTGKAHVFLNVDPIGTLARWGALGDPVEEALADAMALARDVLDRAPAVRAIRVDGSVYHEAGATEAQELSALAATLVAYLRTFEAAGIGAAQAVRTVSFALAADADQFMTIAKLRAARRIVWRIAEASGGVGGAHDLHLTVRTSRRMMAQRDPWTNLLRTTLACAGAALGGADAITVRPFTEVLGEPDPFARRTARNIQIVLQEESGLGRVVDPAGGSWYVEKLTSDLAAKAWSLFQDIEAKGGIIAVLGAGSLQTDIAAAHAARDAAIATGRAALTGVSAFPKLGDDGVTVAPFASAPPMKFGEIMRPLAPVRSAEPFEALRDAADARTAKAGAVPTIFLASIGAVIDHTARTTWIKNFLAAGGIESAISDGYPNAEAAAAAFRASGLAAACICSSDALYAEHAEPAARALKSAGAKLVLMAGKPAETEPALKAAGVDQFLFAGQDAVKTLAGLQEKLT